MKILLNILILLFMTISNTYSFESKSKQAVLIDYDNNEVLYAQNANFKAFPSSLTKIMTAYLIFEDLANGKLQLTDKAKITKEAWEQEGSRMFLNIGSEVTIDELLKGLIVQSGNDAAYTLAEKSTGSIDDFVERMNDKAKELNLKNTHFTNPIGFSNEGHYMSVKDTALLSKELIKRFSNYYSRYYSMKEYKYNNILQYNRNDLLGDYEGVDGIKTGHTEAGGYALATSATKDNRRLISVVNGSESEFERANESRKLLNFGFLALTKYKIYEKNQIIKSLPVKYGKKKTIDVIINQSVYSTAKKRDDIIVKVDLKSNLKAPIKENEKLGTVSIKTDYDEHVFNLYSKEEIKEVGIFKKILLKIYYFFQNLF